VQPFPDKPLGDDVQPRAHSFRKAGCPMPAPQRNRAEGFQPIGQAVCRFAWLYYGSDPFSSWGEGRSPFDRTKDIHCPIMGHFGEDDKNPSPADMRKLDAEMTRLGKAHEFHSYANAAHAFANFGSGNYREHAANASWPRTFEFFNKHLKGT
jgi:dienelactone hydrolase